MILIYPGTDGNRLSEYRKALSQYEVIPFGDEKEDMTMAEIVKEAGINPGNPKGVRNPFLFFVNEDRESLSGLLSALEENGLDCSRSAVLTENNRNWKFRDLYEEISREAAYFAKREELADAVAHADPEKIRSDEQYGRIIYAFYEMLQAEKLDEEVLDLALQTARLMK
ncbi:MAG: DUF3783 domain-containing protein [Erysipelotrichaceae bacterium]|nr:DUF3783 domain-containing protein [Erysipelotrichaceae bacterium]